MRSLLAPHRVHVAERVGFWLYVLAAAFFIARSYYAGTAASSPSPATPVPAEYTGVSGSVGRRCANAGDHRDDSGADAGPDAPGDRERLRAQRPAVCGSRRTGGYAIVSPISGKVGVVVYQFLGGDVRIGSNIPSEPFFPYVTVTSTESTLVLRPGALGRDVQLLVTDGQLVAVGTPLFNVVSGGASSWQTFYDARVTAQVIASLVALPSGAELDAVPLFGR